MNVAILGAGLSGRLLAWQLLEHGHAVSLYDRDNGDGALSAGIVAAAMLAPYSEILDAEPVVYQQGIQGFSLWQLWAEQLQAATQIDIGLQLNGSVVVAHRNDLGDYQRFMQRLSTHPSVNQANVEQVDRDKLLDLEPELAQRFEKACFLKEEGCLDNAALFVALAARINQLGGEWHVHCEMDSAQFRHQYGADKDWIIDCRGFGAQSSMPGLRGVRGEVMRVKAQEVNLARPVRLMHPRYKLYIAPKPDHEYVIGATQIESSSEHGVSVRSSMELLSALYSVHPGFGEAEILSISARCRPAFSDNLPRIQHDGQWMSVNGLYRHGYLLSPSVVTQALWVMGVGKVNLWPALVCEKQAFKKELLA
jgi:glycine oxidase